MVKVVTKVSGVVAVALGGIAGLNWGCTRLFLWFCGPPRPSTQARLALVVADRWVRKFDIAEEIQRIDFQIQRKRFQSAKQWLLLMEAFRRLQSGDDLVRRQREVEGRDSRDLEPLNSFLRLEKGVARGLYESCCVLTAELSLLDERKSLLVDSRGQKQGPYSECVPPLHIHRNSQLWVVNLNSINLRLQEERTAPPSGSGNRLIAPEISGLRGRIRQAYSNDIF